MSRKSYEAFRAGKASSNGRRGSLNESVPPQLAPSITAYSVFHPPPYEIHTGTQRLADNGLQE